MTTSCSRPKLTLVTGFFDIGRETWTTGHKRPLNHYLRNGIRTLSLTDPMVIYVQQKHEPLVWAARRGKEDITRVIVREVPDLRLYALKDRIQTIMDSPEYQAGFRDRDPPQCIEPLYDIVIYSKLDLVAEVVHANPYQSDRFMWIDWGIHPHMLKEHMLHRSILDTIHTVPEQLKCLALSVPDPVKDRQLHTFMKSHLIRLGAPVLSGSGPNLLRMRDMQDEAIQVMLNEGLVDSEQSVWAQIWLRDPGLFDLHYGFWGECLSNWDGLSDNRDYVLNLIHSLEAEGRPDAAQRVKTWATRGT